jgi:hypothetical protein
MGNWKPKDESETNGHEFETKADQRDFVMMKVLKPLVDGIRCEDIRPASKYRKTGDIE